MFYIIFIFAALSSAVATSKYDLLDQDQYDLNNAAEIFKQFNEKFDKGHEDDKNEHRFAVFKRNLMKINELNAKFGSNSYGINQFTDLTYDEIKSNYLGIRGNMSMDYMGKYEPSGIEAPPTLDYRQLGYVTPVKNQMRCGSCYAFSSIGNIEGQYAKAHGGQAIRFSEQQIVDCDTADFGCGGGWPHTVFKSLASQGGSMREEDYPYKGVQGQCQLRRNNVVARITGGQQLPVSDENSMKDALVQYGPLSIVIKICAEFAMLKNGILRSPCEGDLHAVLLVGYGNDGRENYWIIKNSWDIWWGDQGYGKILMGRRVCDIGSYAATAFVS